MDEKTIIDRLCLLRHLCKSDYQRQTLDIAMTLLENNTHRFQQIEIRVAKLEKEQKANQLLRG